MTRAIRSGLETCLLLLRGKSTLSSVVKTFVIRIALLAINFCTGVIVARSLGPEGRGEQTALVLWPGLIATLAVLGMPTALTYFSRREPEAAKRLYIGSAVLMLVLGVFATVVGVAAMPLLLHGSSADTIRAAQWFMLFAPETMLSFVARAHIESQDLFGRWMLSSLYSNIGTLAGLCVLRITGHLTPVSSALCYVVPPVLQAAWLLRNTWEPKLFRLKTLARDMRRLLPYGLRCYGSDIIGALSTQMDLVVIVAFLSRSELGLYTVALSLSRLINVVHTSLVNVLFSRASALGVDDAVQLVARAARIASVFSIVLGLAFYAIARAALPVVYGAAFSAAVPLLALLTAEAVVSGLTWVLFQAFMATGRPVVVTIIQGFWIAAAVGLLFLLIPRMNIAGAAAALFAASIIRLGLVMAAYPIVLRRPMPKLIVNSSDFRLIAQKMSGIRLEHGMLAVADPVGGHQ